MTDAINIFAALHNSFPRTASGNITFSGLDLPSDHLHGSVCRQCVPHVPDKAETSPHTPRTYVYLFIYHLFWNLTI